MQPQKPPLSPEEWSRIQDAVSAAIGLPRMEGRKEVEHRLRDQPRLRAEALAMLDLIGDGEVYLHSLAERVCTEERPVALEGRRVGPYRLIECIARGGMGAVYRAERVDRQFEMEVAVKLLPVGVGSATVRRRFLVERKILASLDHPGIARLFDGGFLDDGTPYFVMEFVKGDPIDLHCDSRRYSLPERLSVVEQICEAVQYAHRNLVVHRDLKPGNILITPDGRVKLLDFGIAKVLDAEATGEPTALTQLGGRPMTPAYASPEQVRGDAVTTATDVYSIGVLLYRLTTGRSPYRIEPGLSRGELERLVCEEEPLPPSRAVRSETPPGMGEVESLRRALRGDLDTIVMKALHKDPARRYGSAAELLEDLRAYRSGWPVRARPDTWTYRSSRFIRRHARSVALLAAVLIALAAYLVTLRGYAGQLEVERDRARYEAAKAAEVSTLLTDLFQGADPTVHQGTPSTVRELLHQGAERIEEELADVPDLQAEMLDRIATIYLHLGLHREALAALERAVALDEASDGPGPRLQQLRSMAYLRMRTGDFAASDSLYAELESRVEARHGRRSVAFAELRYHQGLLYNESGEVERSDEAYRVAVRTFEALDSIRHPSYAIAASNLSRSLARRGQYDEAETYARRALALRRELLGDGHPDTVQSRSTLSDILRRRGDFTGALVLLEDLVAVGAQLYGRRSHRVSGYMNELALTLTELGRFSEAEPLFLEAIDIQRELDPDGSVYLGTILTHFGLLLERSGRLEEAAHAHREAVSIWSEALDEDHRFVAIGRMNLATIAHRQGRWPEAERFARAAEARQREILGGEHPDVGRALVVLGGVLRDSGRVREAADALEEGMAILQAALPPEHPRVLRAMVEMGALQGLRGNPRGRALLTEALGRLTEMHSPGDPRITYAEGWLGIVLAGEGRTEEARPRLARALDGLGRDGADAEDWLRGRLVRAYDRLPFLVSDTAVSRPDPAAGPPNAGTGGR